MINTSADAVKSPSGKKSKPIRAKATTGKKVKK